MEGTAGGPCGLAVLLTLMRPFRELFPYSKLGTNPKSFLVVYNKSEQEILLPTNSQRDDKGFATKDDDKKRSVDVKWWPFQRRFQETKVIVSEVQLEVEENITDLSTAAYEVPIIMPLDLNDAQAEIDDLSCLETSAKLGASLHWFSENPLRAGSVRFKEFGLPGKTSNEPKILTENNEFHISENIKDDGLLFLLCECFFCWCFK